MPLRFPATAVLALLGLLALLPLYCLAHLWGGGAAMRVSALWHRFVLRLVGVRVRVTGAPAPDRPLLLLANHVSWLDIPVLASLVPASFVAKAEVAGWPVIGWLARLQRSVFVDRQRRQSTRAQVDALAARLGGGDVIVLFAEGTSSDGVHVLPFRSSLVGAAQTAIGGVAGSAVVQPVAIAYPRLLGLPLGRRDRPRIAWYGDTDLLPHLRSLLSVGAVDVHVAFGPPRRATAADDRKEIAAAAGLWTRGAVAAVVSGRLPSGVTPLSSDPY